MLAAAPKLNRLLSVSYSHQSAARQAAALSSAALQLSDTRVDQVPSIVRRVEQIVRHFMPAEEVRCAVSRAEHTHGTLVCADSC